MSFSKENLNNSKINSSDTLNNCFPAILEMAESENPYVNEMTLPAGTAFFAKSTVPEGQPKPYVEIDCKPRTMRAYSSLNDDNRPGIFVSQTVVLSLYGFNALQAATLRSRMIRYGLLAQNFGVANSPTIEDELLASALVEPEDAQAPKNTPAVLNEPVKIISFDLNYWQENNETPDRKAIRHTNVTWTDQ